MSLLEVLLALSIFLFALIGVGRLISLGADHALEVQKQARATVLCQSKMDEVAAGVVPLSPQTDMPFDEDSKYTWSLDCTQGNVAGLWNVTIKVSRQAADGSKTDTSLSQMVLDPAIRGNAGDIANIVANAASQSSSSTDSSGSSTTQPAAATPATATPALSTPAAAPAKTTGTAPGSGSKAGGP
jgi:hypothetical protein